MVSFEYFDISNIQVNNAGLFHLTTYASVRVGNVSAIQVFVKITTFKSESGMNDLFPSSPCIII